MRRIVRRNARSALVAASLALVALGAGACSNKKAEAAPVETATVARQDIVIDVEATGVIAPINAIDVRSKASGQITAMPVETGSEVKPGDLLVRIDPRDAQNRYNQAAASLRAAQASVTVTKAQYERAQQLAKEGVITAPELESATLAYANAQSQVAAARTNVQLAQISLEDVTIRAPVAGTVISKSVSLGQVVASTTNSVSGGTALLSLADLGVVYDSTLVTENDIGKVKPGQRATITVDAYPNRTFRGTVEKIEPRATVLQSVTMFPVSIRIENADRALMPGMNTDVSILVQDAPNAVAVPNDAVRAPRDALAAATALGVDPGKVTALLQGAGGGRGAGTQGGTASVPADSARTAQVAATGGARTGTPGAARGASGDSGVGRRRGGGGGRAGTMAGAGRSQATRGVVFVRNGTTFEPRLVTLGVANYDVTQVVSGLAEGEQVALVSAAVLQQSRTQQQERLRSRTGLPGMGGQPAGGGGGGTRGGGAGGAGRAGAAGGAAPSAGGAATARPGGAGGR